MDQDDKFNYIENLISELSNNKRYVVLVFALKCQQIEYALKYLLGWYPFKSHISYDSNFLEQATLGQVIGKLDEINSEYLVNIVDKSKKFLKIRNEITHHFLTTDKTIQEIEIECTEKIIMADDLRREIMYLLDFTDDVAYGFSPGHRL